MALRRALPVALGVAVVIGALVITQLLNATSPGSSEDGAKGLSPGPWRPIIRTIDGTGYTIILPHLWYDVTEDDTSSPKVTHYLDSSSQWGNGRANVVVYGPYHVGERSLDSLRELTRVDLRANYKVKVEDGPSREFDGVEGLGLHLVRRLSKDFVSEENYWCVALDGRAYLIVARREAGDTLAPGQFDEMFETWSWEGAEANT